MSEPPFDLPRAQRWFAVELNNLAWDLWESKSRSAEDDLRMLHAAHASCHHWLAAGTAVNHLRAQCLLANVYASLGDVQGALRHAQKCLELSDQLESQQTPFDRATALAAMFSARLLAGQTTEASRYRELAQAAGENIADADSRKVFLSLFPGGAE